MEVLRPDLCIIGAGSAGLSVAAGAARMGARVVLVEGGEMGGECLNTGCVPSKALLAAGKVAHGMTVGAAFGVAPVTPQVDFAAAHDHLARTIAAIAPHDSQERFEALGVTVLRAWARFTGAREIEAGGVRVRARRVVIATGSAPLVPPIPGLDGASFLTNETIFSLRERPAHLLILGAGPVGVEMAQAHRRLGCDVTLIEAQSALGREDPECAALVLERLRAEGVRIEEDTTVERVAGRAGAIELHARGGARFTGSHLLLAVGRRANIGRLNLEAAGIESTEAGIRVDAGLRTTNRRVYAIGDAVDGHGTTHGAGHHAGIVIRSALFGLPSRTRSDHVPRVVYTDPELAQVGLTEAEASARHGQALEVARFDFAGNDRAVAERTGGGLIKVMVVRGRPVGVSIAGSQAGELIGFWALAIASRLKMAAIAGAVMPYPTLGEANKRAAGAYFEPRLFENPRVKRIVALVQRFLP